MDQLPNSVIKRLILPNAVTLEKDLLSITILNKLSPFSLSKLPDNPLNFIEIRIDNEVILNASQPDLAQKVVLHWQNHVITLNNMKEIEGKVLPIGGKLIFRIPNIKQILKGSKHKFTVEIKTEKPLVIEFERIVY